MTLILRLLLLLLIMLVSQAFFSFLVLIWSSNFFKVIILVDTQFDVLLGEFWTLICAISNSTEISVCTSFVCILLVNEDVLVIHAIIVVFKSHDTSLEGSIFIDSHLCLWVHHKFLLLLLLLGISCSISVTLGSYPSSSWLSTLSGRILIR